MAKTTYHMINNVQTNLLSWGNPFDAEGKDIILCITGNPGVVDFYKDFGTALHENTKNPVCILGHCGHDVLPDKLSNVLKGREHLYNLQAQLNHKRDVINKIIDEKSKLHLIGHSIGAWMLIEILQADPNISKRVKSVHMLFPTVQRMSETFSGRIVDKIVRRLHTLILLFIYCLNLLPKSLLEYILSIYVKFNSLPHYHTKNIMKYLNLCIIEKVMTLAYEEMDTVLQLNVQGLEKIKDITHVIYSTNDSWVPVSYMEEINKLFPKIKMKEVDINHAFVFKSSETVSEMVIYNINNIMTKTEDI